jgi:hypothetical protein
MRTIAAILTLALFVSVPSAQSGTTKPTEPSPEPPKRVMPPKEDQAEGRWMFLPDIGWVFRPKIQPQFPNVPPFPLQKLPASPRDEMWKEYLEWQRSRQKPRIQLPGRPFIPQTMPLGTVPIQPITSKIS